MKTSTQKDNEQVAPVAPEPDQTASGVAEENAADTESVVKSTVTMSMATLLSRITGFARTWACAFALGNTILTSAYQVANNMPNMLYELVAGGILTTAFLPIYISQLKNRGEKEAGAFASNLMSIGAIVLGIVGVLATVFAPQVVFTQTFMSTNQADIDLAIWFFRFFAIQVVFYGVGAIISGILNAHKNFLWPALGPVFNNIVVIATMFAYVPLASFSPELAKVVLAVGTTLGVVAMMAVQIPALIRLKVPLRPRIDFHDPALRETIKLALPATVFVIVNIIVVSVRNAFALGVTPNGPSTLSYAWLWYQFPYGVLAVALSTAMLTEMSASAAIKDWPVFRRNVRGGLSATIFLIFPLAALMFCLAEPLTALYHAGEFNADDVASVMQILQYWCLSLPFYAWYMYVYRAFSALKDLGKATWADAMGRIVQAVLYAVLTMGAFGWEGLGLIGIPIADFVFYFGWSIILSLMLRRKVGAYGLGQVLGSAARTVAAAAVMAVVVFLLNAQFGSSATILTSLVTIVVLGLLGLAIFYGLAKLLRVKETEIFDKVINRVVGKFARKRS